MVPHAFAFRRVGLYFPGIADSVKLQRRVEPPRYEVGSDAWLGVPHSLSVLSRLSTTSPITMSRQSALGKPEYLRQK